MEIAIKNQIGFLQRRKRGNNIGVTFSEVGQIDKPDIMDIMLGFVPTPTYNLTVIFRHVNFLWIPACAEMTKPSQISFQRKLESKYTIKFILSG